MTAAAPASAERATPEDAAAIAACVTAAYEPYIERMGKPPGPMLDDYAAVVARHQVWVVRGPVESEERDRIDGVLVLIPEAHEMLLDNIAVRPEAQGGGIGRLLLELADAEAARQGYAALRLYTHVTMTENVALYRKLGWQVTGQGVQAGYERVYMRKLLDPAGD